MAKPPASLVREWYAKAAEDGFRDIEIPTQAGSLDARLRTDVRTDSKSLLAREGEERAEYYRRAKALLHDRREDKRIFRNADDRRVWAMHANGATIEEIERASDLPHARVQRIIERLARILRNPERRGRPRNPEGRGRDAYQIPGVRLSATEAEAFAFLLQRIGTTPTDVVRICIRAQALLVAERICARTAADMAVPGKGATSREDG